MALVLLLFGSGQVWADPNVGFKLCLGHIEAENADNLLGDVLPENIPKGNDPLYGASHLVSSLVVLNPGFRYRDVYLVASRLVWGQRGGPVDESRFNPEILEFKLPALSHNQKAGWVVNVERNLQLSRKLVYRTFPTVQVYPLLHRSFSESSLPLHHFSLPLHQSSLTVNLVPGSLQKQYLSEPNDDEQEVGNPRSPIKRVIQPVFLVFDNGHRGNRDDVYLGLTILAILCSLVAAMGLGGTGLILAIDKGRPGLGWGCVVVALILAVGACGTGDSGCFPWNWLRCPHDHQEEYRTPSLHDGEKRVTEYLDPDTCSMGGLKHVARTFPAPLL